MKYHIYIKKIIQIFDYIIKMGLNVALTHQIKPYRDRETIQNTRKKAEGETATKIKQQPKQKRLKQ